MILRYAQSLRRIGKERENRFIVKPIITYYIITGEVSNLVSDAGNPKSLIKAFLPTIFTGYPWSTANLH